MKRKKTRIAASLLTSVFAMAAGALHLDWVGYDYFDQENGKNVLCTLDPTCRPLTTEETTLARKYFGERIDYKHVRVFDRPFLYMLGRDYSGMSPNGHIYFGASDQYRPNFARDASSASLFIHEMTHVAQFQDGMNVPKQAFKTLLKHRFNYDAAYKYEIHSPRAYGDMNLEQQAEVMQDYFIKRQTFEEQTTGQSNFDGTLKPVRFVTFGEKWLKERCKELKQYESKLPPTYPIAPDELCQPPAAQKRLKIDETQFFVRP